MKQTPKENNPHKFVLNDVCIARMIRLDDKITYVMAATVTNIILIVVNLAVLLLVK